jgi:hypothetical protein
MNEKWIMVEWTSYTMDENWTMMDEFLFMWMKSE